MSRIGRLPVVIPAGVQVDLAGSLVHIKGPKGEMKREFSQAVSIAFENGQIDVSRSSEEANVRALHGMTRALIQNMVTGVSQGFTKVLEIDGVGYRAEMDGKNLKLFVGYSHPVIVEPEDGISFEVDTKTRQVKVNGYDREVVGQVSADIRKIRPPEPYHGKGIHYLGEKIRRKAGKAGKAKK
ncbi:MAG TPA: 50S ribosomal protein L6 [Bellilinea sp.]|uniref:Large ribosomal subunit protein uL6 n=2 Tax=environmental samples TaxID=58229 RepID=A0A0H4TDI4_9CHLR|nr:50S ribosomal protein L6, large subunit ribosomal protein L6 [uncultured Chloroflexi bacterium Rifle_16ft_4_minimus_640]AKQ05207.1 50S ribosomal protein L6, large subunit ribosomal protein L6 [uncultured Chloroflexi bacterium Rifle_16ft_4_minimus_24332]